MNEKADSILIATSPSQNKQNNAQSLLYGFMAGTVSRTIIAPMDVIKLHIQVSNGEIGVLDTIKKLYREDGIASFWRGNLASCINQGPQTALKFYALEELKQLIGKGKPLSGVQRAFIGSAAGLISQAAVFPLDVLHTRITINPTKYKSLFGAALTMIQEEGLRSLWSGIFPTIAGAIPYEGSQYFVYGGLRQVVQAHLPPNQPISPGLNSSIGALAGIFSQALVFPFDVVRKRMMVVDNTGSRQYTSMLGCFRSIVRDEGVGGLYKGMGINMIKMIPYSAMQYTFYEEVDRFVNWLYKSRYNKRRQSPAL